MVRPTGKVPSEVEEVINRIASAENPAEAAFELAAIANRAAAVLNKLAHSAADQRKGTPEWSRWARLSNAARDAVLRTAATRKAAGEILGRAGES